ncbi:hypothetical protein C8P66_111159 [Humitalea rosea]|uniref:Uncharacterized protein n=1 Tax=Humitalea rosea TaxID=990373 RepID=A0A2W7IG79_9PROT|nr:hypothetical protein [Humitalea rosea]PZW45743.1 hypothetical protein C8P66_111159 [Humitalea rosea]
MRRALLLLVALAGCGQLNQPYRGNPGGEARRLAAPPVYRLAVPSPNQALLTDRASSNLAVLLAEALEGAEVPAVAGPPTPLDWQLTIMATREGEMIRPHYVLADADGRDLGATAGPRVPIRAWGDEGETTLAAAAEAATPLVARLLATADAARRATDPELLRVGGPPRLRLVPVRGAPGDGNASLTSRLREFLPNEGFAVQDVADGAGFAVEGIVRVSRDRVHTTEDQADIQFIVTRRDGEELGRVAFVNNVPTGSLNGFWGDIADVIAQTAAPGIKQVIETAGGFAAGQRPAAP